MARYGDLIVLDNKGNVVGGKVIEMPTNLIKQLRKNVGKGRDIGGLLVTNITKYREWLKLPREKRFTKKYFPIQAKKLNRVI